MKEEMRTHTEWREEGGNEGRDEDSHRVEGRRGE